MCSSKPCYSTKISIVREQIRDPRRDDPGALDSRANEQHVREAIERRRCASLHCPIEIIEDATIDQLAH